MIFPGKAMVSRLHRGQRRGHGSGPKRTPVPLRVEVLEARLCLTWLISSNRTNQVLSYDETTGKFLGVFAQDDNLMNPGGLAIGPDGNLYVASNGTNEVLHFDIQTGKLIDVFASGNLQKPSGLTFGPDGNLYVNSHDTDSVVRFDGKTGKFIDAFVAPGDGGLSGPSEGIAFGPDKNLYVNSSNTFNVLRFDGQTGKFIDVFNKGGDLMHPGGLWFGPDNNLYVASHIESRILRYDGQTGNFIDVFASDGGLRNPTYGAFGNDGNLYVSSRGSQNILRYDGTTGAFIDEFIPRNDSLNAPSHILLVDSNSGSAVGRRGLGHRPSAKPHGTQPGGPTDPAFAVAWVSASEPQALKIFPGARIRIDRHTGIDGTLPGAEVFWEISQKGPDFIDRIAQNLVVAHGKLATAVESLEHLVDSVFESPTWESRLAR
jgi:sugar lactone lactonase YvrE